jgi:nicotinamide riboside transporter PnuC
VIETIGLIVTVLAVTGVILNNQREKSCFYFWMVSNLLSAMIHLQSGVYSLMFRDVIFWGLAFVGLWQWSLKVKD